MRRRLPLLILCVLAIGCARLHVRETLTPYQGDPIEGVKGVTFDGEQFEARGQDPIPRRDIQVLRFVHEEGAATGGADSAEAQGLTPLAASLLERAHGMAKTYPGVPGVIIVDDGEFIYREDGTSLYRYHFAGLILKEEATSWAQFASGFTEGRSRVKLLYARAVAPDGTVSTLPADALQVSSPSEQMQFFNPNRKVMSGVVPGVEVGSVVEYAYEFETYDPEDPRLFFPGYFFQTTEPVVLSRAKVTVPKEVTFHHVTRNFPEGVSGEPVIEEAGDAVTYTWTLEESPPVVAEAFMPPERDVVPMMDGSIFRDFEDAFSLQRELQEARMVLTPDIEAAVKEITAGAETVDEKLARIYYWIQTNTRYVSIKGSLGSGWSGHTAKETFHNRYGDCTDKGVLFATMCKAIGVKSYPIILRTNDSGIGVVEIPTMDGNHCINEIELEDGRRFYLDSTAQNYRYPYFRADDHGAFALNAIRGDVRTIPVPPPEDNQRLSHLDIILSDNGDVQVKTRNAYTGNIEAGIRGYWKSVREDNRKLQMTGYVNSISPGAVLEDFTLSDLDDLSQQVTMTIDYALPGHAIRAKDLVYMRVPTLERTYPEAALETRRHPIQYHTTEERILEIDIRLPKGFRVRWVPDPLDIESPYLEYHARYSEEPGMIKLRTTFRRLKRIVPPEDYGQYRDHLRAISAFSKKEVFMTEGR